MGDIKITEPLDFDLGSPCSPKHDEPAISINIIKPRQDNKCMTSLMNMAGCFLSSNNMIPKYALEELADILRKAELNK